MPQWLQAGGWGLLAGSALLVGAAIGYLARIPPRVVASVMGFGAGVLLSAAAFELIADAEQRGGLTPTVLGAAAAFLGSRLCTVLADWVNVPAVLAIAAGGLLVVQGLAAAGGLGREVLPEEGVVCVAACCRERGR